MSAESFGSILVPVDGSRDANAALDIAAELARLASGSILLVHVAPDVHGYEYGAYSLPREADASITHVAKGILKAAGDRLDEQGISHDDVLARGATAPRILDQADERNVSMIVMGHRGLGAVGRMILGSVSDKVVHNAKCPVLIAPAVADDS